MDNPSPESQLRDWLRHLKAESGASYASIAQAIGEEERTVKRWMPERQAAKIVVPRGDALLKLLDFFGVTLTPPAPRAVALSLLGELRDLRTTIVEGGPEAAVAGLQDLDHRLRELQAHATRTAELTAASLDHLREEIAQLSERLPAQGQQDQDKAAR